MLTETYNSFVMNTKKWYFSGTDLILILIYITIKKGYKYIYQNLNTQSISLIEPHIEENNGE